MSIFNRHPVVPRNGHTLRAGGAARISGCANQKELSLEDQVDHAKEAVQDVYDGPFEFRVIAMTKGKGERVDRPELAEVEAAFRSREFDLVVFEDLGRLVRGPEAVRLLGIAVDHGTRVIVPNDCIDTAESTWEEDALEACAAHVGHNAHTSKRLKQKLKNRFKKFGGATARPIYGYLVPPGAKTYADWLKGPPETERHILEGRRILLETLNCSAARQIPERPTQTAVYRALALDRRMRELGLSSPYVLVTEPPSDYPKLRRHKNPKYRFEPLDGYIPPML